MRRRKEEKLAAELRARGWTCHPPELGVEAIATDPALSLNAKGVYLMHTVGLNMVDVRDRDPRGLQLLAGWAELARAGYMEPLS